MPRMPFPDTHLMYVSLVFAAARSFGEGGMPFDIRGRMPSQNDFKKSAQLRPLVRKAGPCCQGWLAMLPSGRGFARHSYSVWVCVTRLRCVGLLDVAIRCGHARAYG